MKNKFAFTLAEVLITLVIIGVVAALTIPTMVNNLQRNELRSQLKKTLSIASQAVQKMKIDNGDLVYDLDNDTAQTFRDRYIKYFSVICQDNCVDADKYKTFGNGSVHTSYFAHSFIVQDGSSYSFHKGVPSNNLYITVDLNGPGKKPNRWGYDVFSFYISGTQLNPCGIYVPASSIICDKNNSSVLENGAGCTAKALSDANYFKNLP